VPSDQPHILLIITDQQRADTLGFLGQTPCRTPHIDRLAREGLAFDRALTPSPLCTPARAALFSGQYPHQVDMMSNGNTLRAAPLLTQQLRARGYHTAYAGKWHLGDAVLPQWFDRHVANDTESYSAWCAQQGLPDGWTFNDPAMRTHRTPSMSIPKTAVLEMDAEHTIDAWITDHAIELLRERPAGRPFFLTCGYQGPHPPFKIPEPYYSMYDPRRIPEPPNFRPAPHKPRANTSSFYHQLWQDHGADWPAWQKSVAVYWGFVSMIDAQIGRLLAALEEAGVLDDTLVILTSDHGEFLGQHGLWHKMMPYEEDLRVPLVLRYPQRIPAGRRSRAAASLVDIAPTILSVAGEAAPATMQGRDLSPAFTSGAAAQEDVCCFAEHTPLGDWHQTVEWRLVTDRRFKYVWNQGDLDEFYDLQTDPYEVRNLVDDPCVQGEVARLRRRLQRWMIDTGDPLLAAFERDDEA
jgi:choline-sulfatase